MPSATIAQRKTTVIACVADFVLVRRLLAFVLYPITAVPQIAGIKETDLIGLRAQGPRLASCRFRDVERFDRVRNLAEELTLALKKSSALSLGELSRL